MQSAQNISAQETAEKNGTRLQKENENREWQKGFEEKTCKRQSQTHLLSYLERSPCNVMGFRFTDLRKHEIQGDL